jgi:hypothetical protein
MPTPRRRAETFDSGDRVPMNFRVRREVRAKVEEIMAITGRSMAAEVEHLVERAIEDQQQRGGPRTAHLASMLTEIAQLLFPNESDWHDDRSNWDTVMRAWSEALDARAPPSLTRQEQIRAVRRVVDAYRDALREATDRGRLAQLRETLFDLGIDPRLPVHVRTEAMGAAMMELPEQMIEPSEPISLEQQIEAGRGLVDELTVTTDRHRREHLRELLHAMTRLEGLPQGIRQEFIDAAESSVVPVPPVSPPAGLLSDETRPRHVHSFDNAWKLARLAALQGAAQEPDETAIATAFAKDEDAFVIAGMTEVRRDVESVLAYRVWIEEERARAIATSTAFQPTAGRRQRRTTAKR